MSDSNPPKATDDFPTKGAGSSAAASLIPSNLPISSHADPFAAMKPSLGRKATSNSSDDGASTWSDNNNSDNSALVSIGNNSFGFNFPNESSNGSDSDGNGAGGQEGGAPSAPRQRLPPVVSGGSFHLNAMARDSDSSAKRSSLTKNGSSGSESNESTSREKVSSKDSSSGTLNRKISAEESAAALRASVASANGSDGSRANKRSGGDFGDGSEEGYNTDTDDDDDRSAGQATKKSRGSQGSSLDGTPGSAGARPRKTNSQKRRQERNAREKERSFRIARQINELRDLLSAGGVVLPKGTKSSVLTEAAGYIRLLQQHQVRSEIERHQLIQQMHLIGGGANGPEAAKTIRRAAAQNGVWSLGNFGGVPPKSAMVYSPPAETPPAGARGASGGDVLLHSVSVEDYRFVFNSAGVAMAVSSMGGSLIDCNELFCMLSGYTKQELCALTIFNLAARSDLQQAFDLISQMISPSIIDGHESPKQVLLRGAMKSRSDLGLCISLVRGESGVAKCFCITLIMSPSSPSSTEQPVPASFESVLYPGSSAAPDTFEISSSATTAGKTGKIIATTPAFTSG